MTKNNIFLTFVLALILSNCASFEAQYKDADSAIIALPNKAVHKTFYLVGDAGISPENGFSDGLKAYKNFIKNKDTKGDVTLFLGDNIYPAGLPSKELNLITRLKIILKHKLNLLTILMGR